jgi:hypothetical protein
MDDDADGDGFVVYGISVSTFPECAIGHPDDHWKLNPICQSEGCERPKSDWPHNDYGRLAKIQGNDNGEWHIFEPPREPLVFGENAYRLNDCRGFIDHPYETNEKGNYTRRPVDQCGCQCHWGTYYVNVYEIDRVWGGAEEGGWWYDSGEPVASIPFDTMREAEAYRDTMRVRFPHNRSSSSVTYAGGDYQVTIERMFARPYPEERPRYE